MVTVSVCGAGERNQAIALMHEEFIASRGRSLSLPERFPAAFAQSDATLLAAREGERVVAALLMRPFAWHAAQGVLRGVMIGMVCAHREHRGKGLGSALMAEAARLLQGRADFGVLWTTQPDFYRRLGWTPADCGVVGRMRGEGAAPAMVAGEVDALLPQIHAAREARNGERMEHHMEHSMERSIACYRTLLPPAVAREALIVAGSYALVGRLGDDAYVYELGGDSEGIARLADALKARYAGITLNLMRGSSAHQALASRTDIAWSGQSLAMWLPVSSTVDMARVAGWYVPFLDRI
jgi:predicted N-acetyltransferase YhbS